MSVHVAPAGGGPEVQVPAAPDMALAASPRLTPDGTRLVRLCTGHGCDAQVQVLDLRTGADRRVEALCTDAAELSPDGAVLAWPGEDGVHLVDLASGEEVVHQLAGGGPAAGVGWSPDGLTRPRRTARTWCCSTAPGARRAG